MRMRVEEVLRHNANNKHLVAFQEHVTDTVDRLEAVVAEQIAATGAAFARVRIHFCILRDTFRNGGSRKIVLAI